MSRFHRKLHSEFPLHITGRCNNREHFPVSQSVAWEIFSDYLHMLHHHYGVKIHSFVLMSNHFHLIVSDPKLNLSKGMAILMRESSKEMGRISGRINRIWGGPFHSCIIGDPAYFLCAYKYNYRNPVAARLCENVEDYPWSTLQILLGKKHGIIPLVEDATLLESPQASLDWLNNAYLENEVSAIQLAFKKKSFDLPRDPKTLRRTIIS